MPMFASVSPFMARDRKVNPIEALRELYGDDCYICRFQELGKAEGEFAKINIEQLMKNMLIGRTSGPPMLPKDRTGFGFDHDPTTRPFPLGSHNKISLIMFLNLQRQASLGASTTIEISTFKVPVKFITGDLDEVYISGMKEYIESGDFKRDVPYLEEVVVHEGLSHFNNQEDAEDVNNHIYDFIKNF